MADARFLFGFDSIEKNFICAEVQAYEDLKEYGTESAVKAAGKLRQQGRTCEFDVTAVIGDLVQSLNAISTPIRRRSPGCRYLFLQAQRLDAGGLMGHM